MCYIQSAPSQPVEDEPGFAFVLINCVMAPINWPIMAICCFRVSEKVAIKLLKFSPHFLNASMLSRSSFHSSSSLSSKAARFLFLYCFDCFFLSFFASFIFGCPSLCLFLLGSASKSSEPAGEPTPLLLFGVFNGLELALVHPKMASISL